MADSFDQQKPAEPVGLRDIGPSQYGVPLCVVSAVVGASAMTSNAIPHPELLYILWVLERRDH